MAKTKAERTKEEEAKSLRAERRAAERRTARRAEPARTGRRTDSERRNRLFIIGAVVAVILVAIGFIIYGWYDSEIRPLGKTVLRVEETKFSLGHFERRMRLMREENPFYSGQGEQLLQLPDAVLDQLELEASLLEGAGELDITVSDEEVATGIRDRGNLAEEVEANIYAAELRRQVEDSGLKRAEYEQMLRAQLLEEKVRNYFRYLAPKEEPQVRFRWIIVSDEDQAEQTLQRLEEGEDFAALAEEVSLGATADEQGGEIDWTPRGGNTLAADDVEDFLFEAETGERSDIISAGNLFYIVELLERDEARELDEQQRQRVGDREFRDWLGGLIGTLDVQRDFTNEDRSRAFDDVL